MLIIILKFLLIRYPIMECLILMAVASSFNVHSLDLDNSYSLEETFLEQDLADVK